jgi:O-antigen/teichoic acid export membrane protein
MANPETNVAEQRSVTFAKTAKNAGANLARIGASWLVVLFLPPLLVRVLDKPTYATWVLILQIGVYVAVFDNGIQSAIGVFAARAEELKDRKHLQRTMSNAGTILMAGALVALGATLACSWQLEHLFRGIPASIAGSAQVALLVIGVSLAISLPFSTLAGAFLGLQMNEVNAVAASAGKLLGAVGAAWAAWHHQGLVIMALWIGLGNVVQSAIYYLWWRRLKLSGLMRRAHVTGAAMLEFVRFCSAMFATQLTALMITGMDMPVVAMFDFPSAAYYAVATTASNMLAAPHGAIVTTLIPVASRLRESESPERLGQVLIRTTRYATGILCLLTLPLLPGMHAFLRLWVGSDYAGHATPLALLLIVAQFTRMTLMPYAAIGYGAGQQHRMLISPFAEGIVNLACSVAGAYLWGAMGVALGTLIGAFVGIGCHFAISMPRTDSMRFSRRRLAAEGILRPMACCLPGLVLALCFQTYLRSLAAMAATVAGAEVLTAVLLWRFNFDPQERREMVTLFRNCTQRARRIAGAGVS